MIDTYVVLTDRTTNGGEIVKASVRANGKNVYIDLKDKVELTIKVKQDTVLAAIETEEHG